jgi:hypothetical protein
VTLLVSVAHDRCFWFVLQIQYVEVPVEKAVVHERVVEVEKPVNMRIHEAVNVDVRVQRDAQVHLLHTGITF